MQPLPFMHTLPAGQEPRVGPQSISPIGMQPEPLLHTRPGAHEPRPTPQSVLPRGMHIPSTVGTIPEAQSARAGAVETSMPAMASSNTAAKPALRRNRAPLAETKNMIQAPQTMFAPQANTRSRAARQGSLRLRSTGAQILHCLIALEQVKERA